MKLPPGGVGSGLGHREMEFVIRARDRAVLLEIESFSDESVMFDDGHVQMLAFMASRDFCNTLSRESRPSRFLEAIGAGVLAGMTANSEPEDFAPGRTYFWDLPDGSFSGDFRVNFARIPEAILLAAIAGVPDHGLDAALEALSGFMGGADDFIRRESLSYVITVMASWSRLHSGLVHALGRAGDLRSAWPDGVGVAIAPISFDRKDVQWARLTLAS